MSAAPTTGYASQNTLAISSHRLPKVSATRSVNPIDLNSRIARMIEKFEFLKKEINPSNSYAPSLALRASVVDACTPLRHLLAKMRTGAATPQAKSVELTNADYIAMIAQVGEEASALRHTLSLKFANETVELTALRVATLEPLQTVITNAQEIVKPKPAAPLVPDRTKQQASQLKELIETYHQLQPSLKEELAWAQNFVSNLSNPMHDIEKSLRLHLDVSLSILDISKIHLGQKTAEFKPLKEKLEAADTKNIRTLGWIANTPPPKDQSEQKEFEESKRKLELKFAESTLLRTQMARHFTAANIYIDTVTHLGKALNGLDAFLLDSLPHFNDSIVFSKTKAEIQKIAEDYNAGLTAIVNADSTPSLQSIDLNLSTLKDLAEAESTEVSKEAILKCHAQLVSMQKRWKEVLDKSTAAGTFLKTCEQTTSLESMQESVVKLDEESRTTHRQFFPLIKESFQEEQLTALTAKKQELQTRFESLKVAMQSAKLMYIHAEELKACLMRINPKLDELNVIKDKLDNTQLALDGFSLQMKSLNMISSVLTLKSTLSHYQKEYRLEPTSFPATLVTAFEFNAKPSLKEKEEIRAHITAEREKLRTRGTLLLNEREGVKTLLKSLTDRKRVASIYEEEFAKDLMSVKEAAVVATDPTLNPLLPNSLAAALQNSLIIQLEGQLKILIEVHLAYEMDKAELTSLFQSFAFNVYQYALEAHNLRFVRRFGDAPNKHLSALEPVDDLLKGMMDEFVSLKLSDKPYESGNWSETHLREIYDSLHAKLLEKQATPHLNELAKTLIARLELLWSTSEETRQMMVPYMNSFKEFKKEYESKGGQYNGDLYDLHPAVAMASYSGVNDFLRSARSWFPGVSSVAASSAQVAAVVEKDMAEIDDEFEKLDLDKEVEESA